MSSKRYTEEFKIEAVAQVTQRGYSVLEVADRLGVTNKSLYDWIKKYGDQGEQHKTVCRQKIWDSLTLKLRETSRLYRLSSVRHSLSDSRTSFVAMFAA